MSMLLLLELLITAAAEAVANAMIAHQAQE
jgi:hypothetical protein